MLQEESQGDKIGDYTDSNYKDKINDYTDTNFRTGETLTFTQLSPLKCEVNESRFFTTTGSEVNIFLFAKQ